jgi:group I intron endonuclease
MSGQAKTQRQLESVQNAKVLTGINPERRKHNMIGIYSILNTVSGKRYIGQAANLEKRLKDHVWLLERKKHHCIHLQRAFSKDGLAAFTYSIIEECIPEIITEREQFWMDYYRDRGIYNTAPAAGSPLGFKHSAEMREKCAAANRVKIHSKETRDKMSATHKGHHVGHVLTRKDNANRAGCKLTAEHKAAVSASLMGNKHRLGTVITPKTRAKLSAATTQYWKSRKTLQQIERIG